MCVCEFYILNEYASVCECLLYRKLHSIIIILCYTKCYWAKWPNEATIKAIGQMKRNRTANLVLLYTIPFILNEAVYESFESKPEMHLAWRQNHVEENDENKIDEAKEVMFPSNNNNFGFFLQDSVGVIPRLC